MRDVSKLKLPFVPYIMPGVSKRILIIEKISGAPGAGHVQEWLQFSALSLFGTTGPLVRISRTAPGQSMSG